MKRFIAEKDLEAEYRYVPEVIPPTTRGGFPEKIAIVGAGPAGLTCAYYLATMGYAPTVFEREEKPGGMMTYGIPAYKLPRDVVEAEIDILRELGVEIRCGVDVGKDVTLDSLRDEGFKAFYLAIGAQGSRPLGVEGEDAQGVSGALSFLRETIEADVVGNACEVADEVVVVGGGNTAIDVSRTAVRMGAENVTIVYRRREGFSCAM